MTSAASAAPAKVCFSAFCSLSWAACLHLLELSASRIWRSNWCLAACLLPLPCGFCDSAPEKPRVYCSLHRLCTCRSCWLRLFSPNHEYDFHRGESHLFEAFDFMEDHAHPDSVCYTRAVTVAASHRSERAQAAGCFVVWHGAILSAGESEWAVIWFRAVGRKNLDRRFHLHNLPRALSNDQQ